MKIVILLLILLGSAIGGSQYLKENPINLAMPSIKPLPQEETVTPTPISCSKTPIQDVIEGPYYKQGSPARNDIRDNAPGIPITLSGYVMDSNCNPIAGAWIDFWQADASGNYDNQGFRLRGHQFTDTNGRYELKTVIPGEYPGRTPHIHAKVRAYEGAPITTVQLYIPGAQKNQGDPLYNMALQMEIKDSPEGKIATYNFVIRTE